MSSTFVAGLTASEILEATICFMVLLAAMSTMRCVMMPSKITVLTVSICWSFSASWLTGRRSICSSLSFSSTASRVPCRDLTVSLICSGIWGLGGRWGVRSGGGGVRSSWVCCWVGCFLCGGCCC